MWYLVYDQIYEDAESPYVKEKLIKGVSKIFERDEAWVIAKKKWLKIKAKNTSANCPFLVWKEKL